MLLSLDAFKNTVPPRHRLLGVDLGSKTIGLALSDGMWHVASPLSTLQRKTFKGDARQLITLLDHHQVGGMVVGFPLNMNGTQGPRCQSTRSFIENFLTLYSIPVTLWDERLSTCAVQRVMIEGDLSRARQDQVVDKMAAAFILQGALDFLRNPCSDLN